MKEKIDMIVKGWFHKTVNYKRMDLHKTVVLVRCKSRGLDHEVTKCMKTQLETTSVFESVFNSKYYERNAVIFVLNFFC